MKNAQALDGWSIGICEMEFPRDIPFLELKSVFPLPAPSVTLAKAKLAFIKQEILLPVISFGEWSRKITARLLFEDVSELLFGRKPVHVSARLKRGDEVLLEIHGLPHDPRTGVIGTFPKSFNFSAGAVASLYGFKFRSRTLLRVVAASKREMDDLLRSDKTTHTDKEREATLIKGSCDEILRNLDYMLNVAVAINRGSLKYFLCNLKGDGINCVASLAAMFRKILEAPLEGHNLKGATPGITHDLHKDLPELDKIEPDFTSPIRKILDSIKSSLGELGVSSSTQMDWLTELLEEKPNPPQTQLTGLPPGNAPRFGNQIPAAA